MAIIGRLAIRARLNQIGLTSSDVPDSVIDEALAQVDQEVIIAEERAKLTWEIWDRQTPINGVPAETVLANRDDIFPDGAIYLIKDATTGAVLIFQPYPPTGKAPMTEEQAAQFAQQTINEMVEANARERIIDAVLRLLGV